MENLMLGLKVAAIGIIGVFAVLIILMGAIKFFEFVIALLTKKPSAKNVPAAVSSAPVASVATPAVEDDSELIAVISAAIMAILESESVAKVGSGIMPSFEIKKIKEIKRN